MLAGTLTLSVNGVSVTSATVLHTTLLGQHLLIGGYYLPDGTPSPYGFDGLIDEAFVLSVPLDMPELEYIRQHWSTLTPPAAGPAAYALDFKRTSLTAAGTLLAVPGRFADSVLRDTDMSVLFWAAPRAPVVTMSGIAPNSLPSYVLLEKAGPSSMNDTASCSRLEYRVALEAVPVSSGGGVTMELQFRVDLGTRVDAATGLLRWADSWQTGIPVPTPNTWTFVAVTWTPASISLYLNGVLQVR
jgi:hypothetical protein